MAPGRRSNPDIHAPPASDVIPDSKLGVVRATLRFAQTQPFGNLISLLILAAICGGIWYGVPAWISQTKELMKEQRSDLLSALATQRDDFREALKSTEQQAINRISTEQKAWEAERDRMRAEFRAELKDNRAMFLQALGDSTKGREGTMLQKKFQEE